MSKQKKEEVSQKLIIGLKKARTGIDRTIAMLEEKRGCFEIIQQNLATVGLLKSANTKMLEAHIAQLLERARKSKNKRELLELQAELSRVVRIAQNK